MAKDYAVCKLPEEGDDIINVCTHWIQGSQTMYPPKSLSGSLRKLLVNKAMPNASWPKYPIVVLGYYESFEKAEEKLRKACETSNLETSDEDELKRSRNKRKKKNMLKEFCDEDEKSSDDERRPPLKEVKKVPYPSMDTFSSDNFNSSSKPLHIPSASSSNNSLPLNNSPSNFSPLPSPSTLLQTFTSTIPSPSQCYRDVVPVTPTRNVLSPSPSCSNRALQSHLTHGDKTILSQLQVTMSDLCSLQRDILKRLERIEARIFVEERLEPAVPLTEGFHGLLPAQSNADFDTLEGQLDDRMAKQFVKLLMSVGGKDIQQSTNNMLRRAMVDEVAMTFSFSGKSQGNERKRTFKETKVFKCILVAVQKTYSPEEATESKVGNFVGKWLQQAKTRLDRREKRKQPEDRGEDQ